MLSRKVIDVLPDRTAATSAAWMAAHPEIEVVSRDRGGEYASAARESAPQAVQCADRFHLLKNLGEALEGLLAHHLAASRKNQTHVEDTVAPVWQPKRATRSSPQLGQLQQARREERLARYAQVIALHKLGISQQVIAERTGIGHSTISRWLAQGCFPERKPREQASQVDRYLPYLLQRWEDGCHTIAGLFRELVEQGYKGSYESVRDNIVRLLPKGRKNAFDSLSKTVAVAVATSRQAAFLFLRRPDDLKVEEQEMLVKIRQIHPEVDLAYDLVQQFALMLRTRTGEKLDAWLAKVVDSQICALQSFVLGVERDKAAVVAGLTLPLNNGLVEGKVNKLKLIKRMGYGRAGFPLLRQRVLHAL
jgi:transposase